MRCPLYKKLKSSGTSIYTFPSAVDLQINTPNQKSYFSKYVLLNLPKEVTTDLGGTQSNNINYTFNNFKSINTNLANSFGDRVIESLRNYVANQEVVIRNSKLNSREYYYDTNEINTVTERIFWKWCKEIGIIDFDVASGTDDFFGNLPDFEPINLENDDYLREWLWKEREVTDIYVSDYYQSANIANMMELVVPSLTNLKIGDIIYLNDFNSNSFKNEYFGGEDIINDTLTARVIGVITESNNTQKIIINWECYESSNEGLNSGVIKLKYNRLIQYVSEIHGVSNDIDSNNTHTDVYAHVPANCGSTPDVLFRTIADRNYKPNMSFPILPTHYQPEIVGAELNTSPILLNPNQYVGSHYGQFDSLDFTYECSNGDMLRRSGDFFGVTGNIYEPKFNTSNLDGISLDFNTSHYVKMNLNNNNVTTFEEFNAISLNNEPPKDFEFNAILWFYTTETSDGYSVENLYGISFLDNPENAPYEDKNKKFPTYRKLVANGEQDGDAYSFSLNLDYRITNENQVEAFNPEAINSLFNMNLFNEAMRRLANVNDSFYQVLSDNNKLKQEVLNIKQMIYNLSDIQTINKRINDLSELMKSLSMLQLTSTDSIEVEVIETTPSTLVLNNIEKYYRDIIKIETKTMYNNSGNIPAIISVPRDKNFMVNIINNDNNSIVLPNNNKLILNIDRDLDYRQKMDIYISGTNDSSENKKLDIYINTINPLSDDTSTSIVETLFISNIDLPIYYNKVGNINNSAYNWDKFSFSIDFNEEIKIVSGNILEFSLLGSPFIIENSIKAGDVLQLSNLYLGVSNTFDFSGQYVVDTVVGNKIKMNVSNNLDLINYINNNYPFILCNNSMSILSNQPYISLNKGYIISITRIDINDNVQLSDKYLIEIKKL